jgi:TonB-dependent SusC/RagA subfamily outer membrane receptor
MKHFRGLLIPLFALMLPAWVWAQQTATVTGRITNESGAPLAAVVVQVEGMGITDVTRADGRYRLVIPAARIGQGATIQLLAQSIGFKTHTASLRVAPNAALTHDFSMDIDPLRLDEIVVTGVGLQTRAERLGTARTTVDNRAIQRAAEPNVITALAAKAPGVITSQSSGEPGAGTAIRVRGTANFGASQPQIIVDGVPINNTSRVTGPSELQGGVATNRAYDLNPEDIESIEILKGPAATSIFGASAGAGGAILITTKRGQAGVTRWTLRSSAQFDEPIQLLPLQRKFGSGTSGVATACLANPTPACTHNNPTWGPALPDSATTYDHAA